MSDFNDHLLQIHRNISIRDEDRRPYTEMFETVRDWLMREMRKVDPVFDEMFKGTSLFGSYPNRVRIIRPSEFDIFILLDFPFDFEVRTHPERPGFVRIDSNEWNDYARGTPKRKIYREMFRQYIIEGLNRNKFSRWIEDLIETVIEESQWPAYLNIQYTKCAVAHNIYVTDQRGNNRSISIDFVPAIIMPKEYMKPLINNKNCFKKEYFESFLAIPKALKGCGPKSNRRLTFQLVNPIAERDIIWDKQNLKVVYRLMKSLRNRYGLKRLKSYFLTAIFLWEVKKQNNKFWQKSTSDIFFHMLYELLDYFQQGHLPYYWLKGFNLLSILKDNEILKYTKILKTAYENLVAIEGKRRINYFEVADHFETRD